MTFIRALCASLLLLVGLGAAPVLAERVTVTGEVTYRERIALPADARLRVKLVDLSLATPLTRVQAEGAIASPGQVPLRFSLAFEDRIVMPGRAYGLVAEIFTPDGVIFTNTEPFRLDPLAPPADLGFLLQRVALAAPPAARLAEPVDETPITDITWRATTLRGEPLPTSPASTLSIAGDLRAGGRGGCNSYFAQAQMAGDMLAFSAVAATRMACAGAVAEQEAAFFGVLAETRRFRRDGATLIFLDGANAEIATFTRLAR
ncbi:META domain-containing protein [Arsenicitalea aurantiaca]|nr:META domain-containing protein [Arsenicitalea aurantiaca]